MTRVRIQTRPLWHDGQRLPHSLFDGHEGELIHVGWDDKGGAFGLVDVDGFTDGPPLRFELAALEEIGGAS